jgi:CRISPR system Cascade subunit CasE
MFLSRLTIRQSPDLAAVGALLDPAHDGRRMDAHHRLIWAAFAGEPEARRDFLWREMGQGSFLVLSARQPASSALFEPPEVTEFAPHLRAGDQLAFVLRANAARTVTEADGKKRHRDVVMEALHGVPAGDRAEVRMALAQDAGAAWLAGQGARAGFMVLRADVSAYRVVDLEGAIVVTDPALFQPKLVQGFGRAKAFGCGLMLIRRS